MAQSWVPTLRRRLMLASLDAIASVTSLGRRPASTLKKREDVRRVLVVEPKNIGDVVLTLPFLAQLREVFPKARTTMLANQFARILFEDSDLVDEFIDTKLGWTEEATRYNPLAYNWRELWRLKRQLPERRFDLVFKCCMHIREHLVVGLSGGDRRIAYAFGTGDRVLTDAIEIDDPNRHKSADWLRLLDPFGSSTQTNAPRLRVSESERQWALDYLRERGIASTTRIVGVHPGAGVPDKRWPLDRFREVVQALATRQDVRVLAFIDPQRYGESLSEIEGVVGAKVGLRELMALVEPGERGDPMSPLRWTCKSLRQLAAELVARGYQVSRTVVGELLKAQKFSLQANRKTNEGGDHPDRDAQFSYINQSVTTALAAQQPVISVDTKKKELVGDFKNAGREWRPQGEPEEVRVHDFLIKELGRAVPYGIYDLAANAGWVSVGMNHDTSAFAVQTIRRWWGKRYPGAKRLTSDGAVVPGQVLVLLRHSFCSTAV